MDHSRQSARNAFVSHALDRGSPHRKDPTWIADRLADPTTKILPVWRIQNCFQPGYDSQPAGFSLPELGVDPDTVGPLVFLGEIEGQARFALGWPDADPAPLAGRGEFRDLRQAAPLLDQTTGALLAYARAMVIWHHSQAFCGACGHPTRSLEAGHVRCCTNPDCDRPHFPRTDPAIIVLVTDEERCLLGRQAIWAPGRYSTLAGFVEPGECLEDAVAREVGEETGIRVAEVEYHSSQPWPFPGSLMIGFHARAATTEIHRLDGELEDARWFSRPELTAALQAGTLQTASNFSISFRLLEAWFDAGNEVPLQAILTTRR